MIAYLIGGVEAVVGDGHRIYRIGILVRGRGLKGCRHNRGKGGWLRLGRG